MRKSLSHTASARPFPAALTEDVPPSLADKERRGAQISKRLAGTGATTSRVLSLPRARVSHKLSHLAASDCGHFASATKVAELHAAGHGAHSTWTSTCWCPAPRSSSRRSMQADWSRVPVFSAVQQSAPCSTATALMLPPPGLELVGSAAWHGRFKKYTCSSLADNSDMKQRPLVNEMRRSQNPALRRCSSSWRQTAAVVVDGAPHVDQPTRSSASTLRNGQLSQRRRAL